MNLKIGHVYPELLGLYGDSGNIKALAKRLEWRGIGHSIIHLLTGERIDYSSVDVICIGSGEGRQQLLACEGLKEQRADLLAYIKGGGIVLAICGGYHLLGHYYKYKGKIIEGLGVLDIFTENTKARHVGDIVVNSHLFEQVVVGFENHCGATYIGANTPLGRVACGYGNNGKDGLEGIVYKNVFGTNLYGPLLPKNPRLCDYIILKALGVKYGTDYLEPLDDSIENAANNFAAKRSR